MSATTGTVMTDPTAPASPTARRGGAVVAFLALGGLAFAVLQSLVAPALTAITQDLGTTTSNASWVLTAYLLSASVLTPILGRLGDLLGKQRVLLVILAVAAVGTLLAALATSLPLLIVGRVVQGAAGAVLPLSIGIVRDNLPGHRVPVVVGLLSAVTGIGAGIGIVAAGPIVENLSWHWLFWLPLGLIALAFVGSLAVIPPSSARGQGRLDLGGALVLSVALASLLLAVNKGSAWGWGSPATVVLLVVGVVALVAFVLLERRVPEPLIDMRLMAVRNVWATNLVGLAFGFVMFASFLLVPALLELPAATGYGFGLSVTATGLLLLPTPLAMLVTGPLSGILANRLGPKVPMLLGSVLVVLGYALPAVAHGAVWQIVVSNFVTGAGIGLAFAAMSNAIIQAVPAEATASATSVNAIVRTVGGSIGTTVVASVVAAQSSAQGLPLDAAFTHGFVLCLAVGALAVVAALLLRRQVGARADV